MNPLITQASVVAPSNEDQESLSRKSDKLQTPRLASKIQMLPSLDPVASLGRWESFLLRQAAWGLRTSLNSYRSKTQLLH